MEEDKIYKEPGDKFILYRPIGSVNFGKIVPYMAGVDETNRFIFKKVPPVNFLKEQIYRQYNLGYPLYSKAEVENQNIDIDCDILPLSEFLQFVNEEKFNGKIIVSFTFSELKYLYKNSSYTNYEEDVKHINEKLNVINAIDTYQDKMRKTLKNPFSKKY